uniref:Uncharacterized protein n=1 Tax=Hyaloperonospora arabidopsidis (strain Emoy2) TaxID=559515 RepID=M4B3X9_HYAAE
MSVLAVQITLQPAHGYIPLVLIGTGLVRAWAGFGIGGYQKTRKVLATQAVNEKKDPRVKDCNIMQNVAENLPLFYALLATSSIYRPEAAAAAGVLRMVGYIWSGTTYSTGGSGKKAQVISGFFGTLVLVGLSLEASLRILGHI